jgi:hypothetical protein
MVAVKWNSQLLLHAADDNVLGDNVNTINKNTEPMLEASGDVGLEVHGKC